MGPQHPALSCIPRTPLCISASLSPPPQHLVMALFLTKLRLSDVENCVHCGFFVYLGLAYCFIHRRMQINYLLNELVH